VTGFAFRLEARDGRARAARLRTPHGDLETPLFAPVGTQATVKALTPAQIEALGASLILANTYHLHLRPGADVVERMGGLHAFMAWPHPILTDSGGYQVFSLADRRRIDSGGVTFHSHLDGSPQRFTPEGVIALQEQLGADIIMALDECPPPHERAVNLRALERTHAWAERCLQAKSRDDQILFGIPATIRSSSAFCRAASSKTCACARPKSSPGSAFRGSPSEASRSARPRNKCWACWTRSSRLCLRTGPAT